MFDLTPGGWDILIRRKNGTSMEVVKRVLTGLATFFGQRNPFIIDRFHYPSSYEKFHRVMLDWNILGEKFTSKERNKRIWRGGGGRAQTFLSKKKQKKKIFLMKKKIFVRPKINFQ